MWTVPGTKLGVRYERFWLHNWWSGRLITYPSPTDPIFCTNREASDNIGLGEGEGGGGAEGGRESGVSEKFPRIVYWSTVVKLTYRYGSISYNYSLEKK